LGVTIGGHSFNDLDYADDALLIADSEERTVPILKRFEELAGTIGMHPSWYKTKTQNLGAGPLSQPVDLGGTVVESVDQFVYIGSLQSADARSVADVGRRVGLVAGCMRSLTSLFPIVT